MKILFVSMAESVHTASWINQIVDQNWDIHLFSSHDNVRIHPDLKNITIYQTVFPKRGKTNSSNKLVGANFLGLFGFLFNQFISFLPSLYWKLIDYKIIKTPEETRLGRLCDLIKKIRPDVIHSMEFQAAGYLVLEAKKRLGPNFKFPLWIATIWGSDIYWFGRFREHRSKIKAILAQCDYYSCECQRDADLAQKYGLKKDKILSVGPVTSGFNLEKIARWRSWPPSKRKIILLKGYQGVWGRGLLGLQALKKCAHMLDGYKIKIYSAGEDISTAAYLFKESTGIPVEVIPPGLNHDKLLKLHGQARMSISLGLSDGICVSFLESLAMGSLPIQSDTSCSNEWAEHGQGALFVPPEDFDKVVEAIQLALADDKMVDRAAVANWRTVQKRLENQFLKQKTIDFYQKVLKNLKNL